MARNYNTVQVSDSSLGDGYILSHMKAVREEIIEVHHGTPDKIEDHVACILQQLDVVVIIEGHDGEDRTQYLRA